MTQDEIIEMAQECALIGMRPHLDGIYSEALVAFAKLVAEKALAEHAMRETQRLGQEIEQEPLEYWNAVEGWVKIDEVREHFGAVGCGTIYKTAGEDRVPVYTHPPQRTWVGLNDDEIDYLIHLAYTGDDEFVQTIEAKLKEKNLPCIKPKWIGLTEKEHTEIAVLCGCLSADWVFYGAAVERKLKERNT